MKRSVNKKSSGGGEGISYWESMADGVVGLLLYVLLIVMLLILLLLRTTSEDYIDTVQGDNVTDFLVVTFTKASASDLRTKLYEKISEQIARERKK